jgi:hypothetical protein
MATLTTGAAQGRQPEAVEKGLNIETCRISLSVSWSSGDVHRVGKLPHGAIPLDAIFYRGATAAAEAVVKFGISASQEMFFASATFSAARSKYASVQLGTNKQISLSDDAMPRFDYVTMVATAGVSVGHVGDLIIYYKMPGQTP